MPWMRPTKVCTGVTSRRSACTTPTGILGGSGSWAPAPDASTSSIAAISARKASLRRPFSDERRPGAAESRGAGAGRSFAPAFVLYLWSLQRAGAFGFTPCLMFAVCMALRLARFNAALDGAPAPAYVYNFFTGVPAPAGAGLALFPLFVGLEAKELGL